MNWKYLAAIPAGAFALYMADNIKTAYDAHRLAKDTEIRYNKRADVLGFERIEIESSVTTYVARFLREDLTTGQYARWLAKKIKKMVAGMLVRHNDKRQQLSSRAENTVLYPVYFSKN